MLRYLNIRILLLLVTLYSFPATASYELFGLWEITDAKSPNINAKELSDAGKLFGDTIEYRKDAAIILKELCKKPVYTKRDYNEEDFRVFYGATFKQLGIAGTKVRTYEIQCRELGGSIGSFFILVNEITGYTVWESVFYKLKKK